MIFTFNTFSLQLVILITNISNKLVESSIFLSQKIQSSLKIPRSGVSSSQSSFQLSDSGSHCVIIIGDLGQSYVQLLILISNNSQLVLEVSDLDGKILVLYSQSVAFCDLVS